jgi:hypothetical protein
MQLKTVHLVSVFGIGKLCLVMTRHRRAGSSVAVALVIRREEFPIDFSMDSCQRLFRMFFLVDVCV